MDEIPDPTSRGDGIHTTGYMASNWTFGRAVLAIQNKTHLDELRAEVERSVSYFMHCYAE
jgi:hypothetical protein